MHYLFIFSSLWTILLHCSFLVFAHLTVKGSLRKYTSGIFQFAIKGILLHCNLFAISLQFQRIVSKFVVLPHLVHSQSFFYFFDQRSVSKFVILRRLVHFQSFLIFLIGNKRFFLTFVIFCVQYSFYSKEEFSLHIYNIKKYIFFHKRNLMCKLDSLILT